MNRREKIKALKKIASGKESVEVLKPLRIRVRRMIIGKDNEVLEIQERTVLVERTK